MNKNSIFYIGFSLFFIFFSGPLFASSEIPGYSNESGPEAPPASPIDNYLIYTITICVVFAAYYFYKSNRKPFLKGEN
jgi:hypothetical protein